MKQNWKDIIISNAGDKAKDYFTKGEICFIQTLLTDFAREMIKSQDELYKIAKKYGVKL